MDLKKAINRVIGLFVYSIIAVVFISTLFAAETAEKDKAAVRKAAEGFYSALNVMFTGEIDPMVNVWSHGDDVTYMGPGGGIRVGWERVLADWKIQAALKLGGKIVTEDMHITVGRDLAIVNNYEVGENMAAGGKPLKVKIRATNLFRYEDGKWKMIGHHTDILPSLQK